MEKIPNFEIALSLLKKGSILYMINSNQSKTYFLYNGKEIIMNSEEIKCKLSLRDYQELFTKAVFYLFDENINKEFVDPEKDKEYYSWRQ